MAAPERGVMSGTCHMCKQPYRIDGGICDPCLEIACDIAEANRIRFQKLLAAGVGRAMANRIMIERGEGRPS